MLRFYSKRFKSIKTKVFEYLQCFQNVMIYLVGSEANESPRRLNSLFRGSRNGRMVFDARCDPKGAQWHKSKCNISWLAEKNTSLPSSPYMYVCRAISTRQWEATKPSTTISNHSLFRLQVRLRAHEWHSLYSR